MDQFGTWTDLGRERATDDIARVDDGDLREAIFVHTRATDKFLRASPTELREKGAFRLASAEFVKVLNDARLKVRVATREG